MPPIWGTVTCDSSMTSRKSSGKVVDEASGPRARWPAGDVPGIILDARAVPHFPHHFEIKTGPLFQPLRFQEFPERTEFVQAVFQLGLDPLERPVRGSHVT